ncbi:hypothetical protein D3C81_1456090 [compost metagenome]
MRTRTRHASRRLLAARQRALQPVRAPMVAGHTGKSRGAAGPRHGRACRALPAPGPCLERGRLRPVRRRPARPWAHRRTGQPRPVRPPSWLECRGQRPRAAGPAHRPAIPVHTAVPVRPQHGQLHRPGLPAAPQWQPAWGDPQRLQLPTGSAVPRGAADCPAGSLAPGAAGQERTDRVVVVRLVQQGLQAQPHGVRLAQPRPGAGRPVRQRPAVRLSLQQPVVARPAARLGADQPAE